MMDGVIRRWLGSHGPFGTVTTERHGDWVGLVARSWDGEIVRKAEAGGMVLIQTITLTARMNAVQENER